MTAKRSSPQLEASLQKKVKLEEQGSAGCAAGGGGYEVGSREHFWESAIQAALSSQAEALAKDFSLAPAKEIKQEKEEEEEEEKVEPVWLPCRTRQRPWARPTALHPSSSPRRKGGQPPVMLPPMILPPLPAKENENDGEEADAVYPQGPQSSGTQIRDVDSRNPGSGHKGTSSQPQADNNDQQSPRRMTPRSRLRRIQGRSKRSRREEDIAIAFMQQQSEEFQAFLSLQRSHHVEWMVLLRECNRIFKEDSIIYKEYVKNIIRVMRAFGESLEKLLLVMKK